MTLYVWEIRAAVAAERERAAKVCGARAERLDHRAAPGVNDRPDDTLLLMSCVGDWIPSHGHATSGPTKGGST